MDVFIHYEEQEFQDAYVDAYIGTPVYTSYVELELLSAADHCIDPNSKCEEAALIKDSLPYDGPDNIESIYVVVCRFNNSAANVYEDWNIAGCYVSEEEAQEMADDFSLHSSELSELSDALVLLYCDVIELEYLKV